MRAKGTILLTTLGAALVAVPLLVRAQQSDVDRQVEEAKALYRDGNFSEAIPKLQGAINRMKQLRDIDARKIQLADAYLHLALSYFAVDDRVTTKETFKAMLRVDLQRRLDPQIYAPPVIELFEEAGAEVREEPAAASDASAVRPTPSASPKKGGSKAPLIVLGAAAAAGGVALAAKGSGGSTSSGRTPTSVSATPTPTPTATPPTTDIIFLGSDPPPGSTIRVSSQVSTVLSYNLTVVSSTSGFFTLTGGLSPPPIFQGSCLAGGTAVFSLTAGQPTTMTLGFQHRASTLCMPPFTTTVASFALRDAVTGAGVISKDFSHTYTFVQ